MILDIKSDIEMKDLGAKLGALLRGGEIIELVGDVGAGKTTFTKGLARGMSVDEDVQSPSFTISRVYDAPNGLRLAHYDFYRLHNAGIMSDDLRETLGDAITVTVIEWAEIVSGVLPEDRLTLLISSTSEDDRRVELKADGPTSRKLMEQLA
jgi:tRNA threonylcarbamoyladenosine biosynthesis protein TsaE